MSKNKVVQVVVFSITFFFISLTALAKTPVVLLSIDGFSNEYLDIYKPKHLLELAQNGVRAEHLQPVFPTKTFPNHLSIITGRYPVNHGIIHNSFYAPDKDKHYRIGRVPLTKDWLTGPTIWGLANKHQLKTAAFYWPASDSPEKDYAATIAKPYIHETPNKERFDQVYEWLSMPDKERPDLITFYVSTVDDAGHKYGPNAKETKDAIFELDALIGDFNDRVSKLPTQVNFIIVSDHGMTNINESIAISVDNLALPDGYVLVNGQTQLNIYASPSDTNEDIKQAIKSLKKQLGDRVTIYQKGHFPEDFQLNSPSKHQVNVPDIMVATLAPRYFKSDYKSKATHGFRFKETPQMAAIFIANGPAFKSNKVVESFESIHIFALLNKLMGIQTPNEVDADITKLPLMFSNQ